MSDLYQFDMLLNLVREKFNVDPDQQISTFEPPPKIQIQLSAAELNRDVTIGDDGIYYDLDGKKIKGFLYIQNGYNRATAIQRGWKTIVPKFHICNCETIDRQKSKDNFNGHYVFSNEPISMKDLDDEIKDLLLCGYCKNSQEEINSVIPSTEYCDLLMENLEETGQFRNAELPKEFDTNVWGYTKKWEDTSREYRYEKNFTCESCNIKLDGADGYYLDTHHVSGNKTNNNPSNLKCLCVLCHANVDDIHKRNFGSGRGRRRVVDFVNIHKTTLEELNNPFLKIFNSSLR